MGLMDTIKGWFGTAKEQGADIADQTSGKGSELIDNAEPYVDKTKDFAQDAVDKAGTKVEELQDPWGSIQSRPPRTRRRTPR